jgi:hypothetical protein
VLRAYVIVPRGAKPGDFAFTLAAGEEGDRVETRFQTPGDAE